MEKMSEVELYEYYKKMAKKVVERLKRNGSSKSFMEDDKRIYIGFEDYKASLNVDDKGVSFYDWDYSVILNYYSEKGLEEITSQLRGDGVPSIESRLQRLFELNKIQGTPYIHVKDETITRMLKFVGELHRLAKDERTGEKEVDDEANGLLVGLVTGGVKASDLTDVQQTLIEEVQPERGSGVPEKEQHTGDEK